nr:MAG TPA: hypothetical protein [Caudoviricetes sp.]
MLNRRGVYNTLVKYKKNCIICFRTLVPDASSCMISGASREQGSFLFC